jgi:hypothetical protein
MPTPILYDDETTPRRIVVGAIAIAAPLLHSVTDVMEWWSGGFTSLQLRLNLVAFLPMPFLLLAIQSAFDPRPGDIDRTRRIGVIGRVGAIAYGASFAYFLYSTVYALANDVPDYATLWKRLGAPYTASGAIMVVGGLLFAVDALRHASLPRFATATFLVGILTNLLLAMLPAPEIAQTLGSALRNLGLALMGVRLVRSKVTRAA